MERERRAARGSAAVLTAVHAVYAQVRQTMVLATQREPRDGTWLLRCVAVETCTLMSVLCAGNAGVIRTVCVIVGARHRCRCDKERLARVAGELLHALAR